MTTSIFIRSYAKDFEWLKYCLRSIQKHCRGFHETVIATPDASILQTWGLTREKVCQVTESPGCGGYMLQQIDKLNADRYCSGDYVLFVDSDCTFQTACEPATFFTGDKPTMLITPYSELGTTVPWQKSTEKALGFPCEFETMRRLPMLYPRDLFTPLRTHIQSRHGKSLEEYVRSQPNNAFSEFNAMGSWALKFHPDRFAWLDTTKNPLPPTIVNQNWSYGGITPAILAKMEEVTQ